MACGPNRFRGCCRAPIRSAVELIVELALAACVRKLSVYRTPPSMARFITLFAVVGIASACQTNPAEYLSPSEINLFSSTAEMMGRIASNPTNALNLHDHFCEDGSNRDLLISSGVKMLQEACFPDTSVAGFSLQSIMLELTAATTSRARSTALARRPRTSRPRTRT